MKKYRVAYLGNAAQVAEYIVFNPDMELKQIICERDRVNDDLITVGLVRNVPLLLADNKAHLCELMKASGCDFFLMFSFGIILPEEITSSLEIYNIHSGDLPEYKGRHPTYWATLRDERMIGITLHKAEKGIDTGEIVAKRFVPYYFWMAEDELNRELLNEVPHLLEEAVRYKRGGARPVSNIGGTYYKAVGEEEKTISLGDSYAQVFNKIRTQSKYEGAKFVINDFLIAWIKSGRFTHMSFTDKAYYEHNGFLYLHLRNNVWLKADKYKLIRVETI